MKEKHILKNQPRIIIAMTEQTTEKDQFFTMERRCFHPTVNGLTTKQILFEYATFGLTQFLSGLLNLSVPDGQMEVKLREARVNPDLYVYKNISCGVAKAAVALKKKNDPIVSALAEAFWNLFEDCSNHHFDIPDPETKFNIAAHDAALISFRMVFCRETRALDGASGQSKIAMAVFFAYARSMFECRQFQGPPRLNVEDAIKDSLGRGHLWGEYLGMWNLTDYTATAEDLAKEEKKEREGK